jgi:hypothetical protein
MARATAGDALTQMIEATTHPRHVGTPRRRRTVILALVCGALACLALVGAPGAHADAHPQTTPADVPAAPGPLLWSDPLAVDLAPLNAISCPSTGLCVAIDRAGGILWSTHPTGPAGDWHLDDVDLGNELTGISCPSTALCVAVDAVGSVLLTTLPTAGAGAWSAASVDKNATALNTDTGTTTLTRSISCPSTTLCVAVDAVGDAFVSTDPTGGAGAWTASYIDPGRTRGCTTAGLGCQAPLVGVSCPSTTLCAAVDFSGDILTTLTPTATTPWTLTATTTRVGSLWALSCPTAGFCAAPDGSGRTVLTFDPLTPAAIDAHVVSDAVYGISCPTAALCLGDADSRSGTSGLLGTADPTARGPRWLFGPPGAVNGVACPSASICIAADGEGNVSTGVPESAIAQELSVDLLPARHPTRQALAAAGSETVRFASPFAAQVQLTWTSVPSGDAPAAQLATADYRFSRPGATTFHLRLTAAGRRALRARPRLVVSQSATFATDVGSLTRTRQLVFAATPAPRKPAKKKRPT